MYLICSGDLKYDTLIYGNYLRTFSIKLKAFSTETDFKLPARRTVSVPVTIAVSKGYPAMLAWIMALNIFQ